MRNKNSCQEYYAPGNCWSGGNLGFLADNFVGDEIALAIPGCNQQYPPGSIFPKIQYYLVFAPREFQGFAFKAFSINIGYRYFEKACCPGFYF
ncbi:MAG: hypothetical protein H6566_20195 [Lewinellaceae bacterium]|nr:hypothetical protein [Lewinellaceae bacterium]